MTREELIKERDDCSKEISKYAKKKKKFVYFFSPSFIAALIILIIDVSLVNNVSGETVKPGYYYPLLFSALGLFIFGLVMLGLFLRFHINEKKYQRKRDLASNKLLGLSLNNKN